MPDLELDPESDTISYGITADEQAEFERGARNQLRDDAVGYKWLLFWVWLLCWTN